MLFLLNSLFYNLHARCGSWWISFSKSCFSSFFFSTSLVIKNYPYKTINTFSAGSPYLNKNYPLTIFFSYKYYDNRLCIQFFVRPDKIGIFNIIRTLAYFYFFSISHKVFSYVYLSNIRKWPLVIHLIVAILGFPSISANSPKLAPVESLAISICESSRSSEAIILSPSYNRLYSSSSGGIYGLFISFFGL